MKHHHILIIISLILLTSCATTKQSKFSCPKFDTKSKSQSIFTKNKPKTKKTKENKFTKNLSKPHLSKNKKTKNKQPDFLAIKSITIQTNNSKSWSNLVDKRKQPKINTNKIFPKNKKKFTPRKKSKKSHYKTKIENKSTKVKEEYKLEKSIVYNGFNVALILGLWIWFILSPAALPLLIMLPLSFIGFQFALKARRNFKKDYKLLGRTINGFYLAILYISMQLALILIVLHFQSLL